MKKIISLEIPIELKEELSKIAQEKEMSVSGLIRYILKSWVEKK